MRPIDADTLIIELEKDEALFDNEATVARENSIKYTDNYAKIMWSRANGIRDAIIEVYDAPTIDAVEVVRGEWITIDTEVISVPVYWNEEQRQSDERGAGISEKCECSVCGWRKIFMGYKKLGVNKSYNFCPNCGAKMKGADDE